MLVEHASVFSHLCQYFFPYFLLQEGSGGKVVTTGAYSRCLLRFRALGTNGILTDSRFRFHSWLLTVLPRVAMPYSTSFIGGFCSAVTLWRYRK